MPKQQASNLGYSDTASASAASSGSDRPNSEVLPTTTADKTSASTIPQSQDTKIAPVVTLDAQGAALPGTEPLIPTTAAGSKPGSNSNTNKHNLRILNFLSLDTDRLPGLTPPLFTPGGRRLPPIHFSPGAALGSPGTPGHLWSSLLSATNGTINLNGQDTIPQFANMLRKLGLTPNESNLRSGLTPSIMAQQGFNFNLNTPGGFPNGQMTPGLLNLLGLTNSVPVNTDTHELQIPQVQPPVAVAPSTNKTNEPKAEEPIEEEDDLSGDDSNILQDQKESGKRLANDTGLNTKKAKTVAKGKESKKKEEPKKTTKATTEDEKRKQFLERNRVAASKCRQRKKQLFSKMESELSFYSSGYRELSIQVTQLRDQLLQLRGILTNHRDCPGLVSSVGGYRQMQNLLGQTDFIAQAASNSQPNYTSMPTTIPTELNPQPPMKNESTVNGHPNVDVGQQIEGELNHVNGQMGQVGQVGVSVGTSVNQVGHITGNQSAGQVGQPNNDINMRMSFQQDVDAGNFQNDVSQTGLNDLLNLGENLRPINSTSNLQSEKLANDSYGLRSVASMADLQHGAQQAVAKHFYL